MTPTHCCNQYQFCIPLRSACGYESGQATFVLMRRLAKSWVNALEILHASYPHVKEVRCTRFYSVYDE